MPDFRGGDFDFEMNGMDQGFNGFSLVIYEGNTTCRPDQFKCDNRDCIYISLKCDGYIDCMDGSDEANCRKYTLSVLKIMVLSI